jgi:hypothetical protein
MTSRILSFKDKRSASGELPLKFLGSVPNAEDASVQEQAVVQNPMRMLTRAICYNCRYEWQAPVVGLCPMCHTETVAVIEQVPCMAARI